MAVVEVKDDSKIRALRYVLAFVLSPPLALAFASVIAVLVLTGMESLCPEKFLSSGGCLWEPRWIREIPFGVFAMLAAFLWVVLPTFLAPVRDRRVARFFFTWGAVASIFLNYSIFNVISSFGPAPEEQIMARESVLGIILVVVSLLGGMLGVKFSDRRLARIDEGKENAGS